MASQYIPKKVDLKPKRYHFYNVFLFICGSLFPPLAVAARFGIGADFWLNLLLTICGYIPGHGHNFYIQNIRNNKNHRRTPKWAQRYGLVDTSEIKRKERKSQWAGRYNERTERSQLEGRAYEDGQTAVSGADEFGGDRIAEQRTGQNELWNPEEERFYGNRDDNSSTAGSGGRWHYPANFDDADPGTPIDNGKKKKKKEKKDRWARTEDAYSQPSGDSSRKKRKSSRRRQEDTFSTRTGSTELPEDPEGGLHGNSDAPRRTEPTPQRRGEAAEFDHQF